MPGKRGLFIVTALVLVIAYGCPSDPGVSDGDIGNIPLWGFALHGHPVTEEMIDAVAENTGFPVHFVVFFIQWPEAWKDGHRSFPGESVEAIESRGAMPCITWEPMYICQEEERAIHWEKIIDGHYDEYIRAFATGAKAWGRPLMVRFAHEMNLSRYHWGTDEQSYGPESTVIYQKLFRYVVTLFREENADNVLWVFCPNAESVPGPGQDPAAHWNRIEEYYPGHSYVDILGVDGYNWGSTQRREYHGWDSHWQSFRSIFESAVTELRTVAPGKPIFIFETASVDQGGDRIRWIAEALETARSWNIEGIAWFQADKEVDWTIRMSDRDNLASLVPATEDKVEDRLEGVRR